MALTVSAPVMAADDITTTIGGQPTERTLSKITFDRGDSITLTFTDGTTETADMSLVEVMFGPSGSTAIDEIKADPGRMSGVYNLKGQRVAHRPEGLVPGVYIFNGEKLLVK